MTNGTRYFSRGTDTCDHKRQSAYLVSKPIFETGTFRIGQECSPLYCEVKYRYPMSNKQHNILLMSFLFYSWPGSSVGIATGYGLDGLGIESR